MEQQCRIMKSDNQFPTIDFVQYLNQTKKTEYEERMGNSKTIDLQNNPRLVNKSYQSNTYTQSRPVDNKVQRHNQDNFLPRTAWTDMAGSDDWLQNDNSKNLETNKYDCNFFERPSYPSPPDLISNKCRRTTTLSSRISTSDITVSPSSSESYPECQF